MNLAHGGATTGLDDIFPGLGLAFSWKGARMQYAVTPSLLWCYRLFYSKIPEVVSVLFSKKKGQFRVYGRPKHTEKAQFEKNMWTVS